MKTELSISNEETEAKLRDIQEKYDRLLKAKEATDIRILELHDKNAELSNDNNSKMKEISNLKEQLNKSKEKNT